MLLWVLIIALFSKSDSLPDNNTFMNSYTPPIVKKMKNFKQQVQRKACAPFLDLVACDTLSKINTTRDQNRLPALIPSEKCTQLARHQSEYMVGLSNKGVPLNKALNHDGFKERVTRYKLSGGRVTENVAAGGSDLLPDKVVKLWLRSKGHLDNILDPKVRYTGLSAIKDSHGNIFWTQCFSSQK